MALRWVGERHEGPASLISDFLVAYEAHPELNPFSAGTAFMLMQTGWIQASRRVTRRLA